MSTVILTEPQFTEVLTHAEIADPARYPSRIVGHPAAVARFRARIPETYSRLGGQPIPVGWSGTTLARDPDTGEVEVEATPTYRLLDEPGAELSIDTAGLLLAAVGERGDRQFSLEFRFDQFSGAES